MLLFIKSAFNMLVFVISLANLLIVLNFVSSTQSLKLVSAPKALLNL